MFGLAILWMKQNGKPTRKDGVMAKATRKVKGVSRSPNPPKQNIPKRIINPKKEKTMTWLKYPENKPVIGTNYFTACLKETGEWVVIDTGHMSETEFLNDVRYGEVKWFTPYINGSQLLLNTVPDYKPNNELYKKMEQ